VEVESLVAEQGVGVVKLEQVDALTGVVVAAGLHVSVAVPPVHRHDLPITTSQGAPGASLYITNWDRVFNLFLLFLVFILILTGITAYSYSIMPASKCGNKLFFYFLLEQLRNICLFKKIF